MLADQLDVVIGVDTHRDRHAVAITDPSARPLTELEIEASEAGYARALEAALASGEHRLWAIEGTGCYGAGLASYLVARGEAVVEVDRPKRPARRDGAKSDPLDAIRAAREALSREQLALPRQRGWREGLRTLLVTRAGAVDSRTKAINCLRALIVSAPEPIREELRGLNRSKLLRKVARMRIRAGYEPERRALVLALRANAKRALALEEEAQMLSAEITAIVAEIAPELTQLHGVGVISAAQLLVAYSHHERVRSEAAFASLAGAAPIPASSGNTVRYRLSRGGDRQLNRALHTIARTRLQFDAKTRDYAERRRAQGKSDREIRRSLVRYLARSLYRVLAANPRLAMGA